METTTVRVRQETKDLLVGLKIHPRETLDQVIFRLAHLAYDDENVSAEELRKMEAGIQDIRSGRTRSLDEVARELGS